ncbi:hypothetical protein N7539_002788 [Penicillium diatomitis]|uniref:Ubiquitin-conjugating enzyme E2 2 n=1 Tax=Penicillium diatomitis TaxID=2819901 RepID=A0A9W9XFK4_9EURO|nr:uncharacterized protein N7539_002788 [Penicillium diatomitis]KAJ5491221.1 hypothetical protein N7539_002788 [Penicillium diatomitis]
MVSNLRRLAADHAALHGDRLPPYYLLPSDDGRFESADDLSQLNVLITGPPGTPYAGGLWRLHLNIPRDYPKSPPTAVFRTKIWHPNVEELTGAVCVDTLKRDWQSTLTLRDVLVTISCLLIHPNPDSALNSTAGTLLREDFAAFSHRAKLLTSIHAPIPPAMEAAVKRARDRGEEPAPYKSDGEDGQDTRPRKQPRLASSDANHTRDSSAKPEKPLRRDVDLINQATPSATSEIGTEDAVMADVENNSTQSRSFQEMRFPSGVDLADLVTDPPMTPVASSPRNPLSVITSSDPDASDVDRVLVVESTEPHEDANYSSLTARNVHANMRSARHSPSPRAPRRLNRPLGLGDGRQQEVPDRTRSSAGGQENRAAAGSGSKMPFSARTTASSSGDSAFAAHSHSGAGTARNPCGAGAIQREGVESRNAPRPKTKGRVGIRRL